MKCSTCNKPFKAKELTKVPFKATAESPEIKLSFCSGCLMEFVTKQTTSAQKNDKPKQDERMKEPQWDEQHFVQYEKDLKKKRQKNKSILRKKEGKPIREGCQHEKISLSQGEYFCKDCKKKMDTKKLDR